MPTYTYECKKCGQTQDVFHSMTANPRVKCPECGGACKRLLGTGAGIIFKGSGFYETDYKRNGKSGATSTPKKESSSSESKSESKSSDSSKGTSSKSSTSSAKKD